ncbi:hypothetical protein SGL43_05279 [Streptomyces globisporus]|uniref:Uncharacterized protein n=1 Tax=Streptomyces globisporus TaxID=1908 RepID=A0ABM9H3N2_STRGL|nr:hypothetical protein SGL43_05279 [Streptomyces globisporus]
MAVNTGALTRAGDLRRRCAEAIRAAGERSLRRLIPSHNQIPVASAMSG